MKIPALMALCVFFLGAGCSKHEGSAKSSNDLSSGNPITAPVDYLGAVAKGKRVSEKVIDRTSINQAIQLFYAQEDRFPKDLNELAAKHYIASVPPAPAGARWVYNPQTGEIKAVRTP